MIHIDQHGRRCSYLAVFCGYVLARKGLFPPAASKGASQVTMNISLPLLVFANIVPAFTPQNISALGPLFLTAFVYMALGFAMGAIVREVCYVPRNFWQGIIILTGMSNWGNLRWYPSIL
jgi:auxin efflux carrier family protein